MTREIKITTPEHVELTFELAGLGSRFVALLLDSLLQGAIIILLVLAAGAFIATSASMRLDQLSGWVIALLILVIFALSTQYFLYFEAVKNGQTPGKKAAGIRVILDTGHPIDFRGALLRNIVRLVDVLPGTYAVGIVSIFASSEYRRLGDYVAGTLVVRTGKQYDTKTPVAHEHDGPITRDESDRLLLHTVTKTPLDDQGRPLVDDVDGLQPVRHVPDLPQEALPYLHSVTRDDYKALCHFLEREPELNREVAESLAKQMAIPLVKKLHLDSDAIDDHAAFLQAVSTEWARRMVH